MTRRTTSRAWVLLLSLALLVGGLALPTATVSAATQHVTDCGDAGANTLRGKIGSAGVGDTIVFDQDCTIILATGTLTLTKNVTIDGTGHTVVVDGGCTANCGTQSAVGGVTVFTVNGGGVVTATLIGLTIQHGKSSALCVVGSVLTCGGGFSVAGTLTVMNCTITGNSATGDGGGIYNAGILTVINSTISGNDGGGRGGGITNNFALTITNSTVTGNTVFSGSARGGGIYAGALVAMTNTIVAGNIGSDGTDLKGTYRSGGHNLIGQADASTGWIASDLTGTSASPLNPVLGTLGTYGGLTRTIPLLPGSPAIAAGGTSADIPTTDQRGVARTGHTDIGAFQSQGFTLTKTGGDNQSQQILAPFFAPLTLTLTATAAGAPWNEPVQGGIVAVTAPTSGAAAIVNTNTVNASGQVSITLTANGTAGGPYTVTVGVSGLSFFTYTLTNLAAPPGATYTVGTTADHAFGPVSAATCRIAANTTCALRDAIAYARSGTDTIVFNGTGQGTSTLVGGNGPLVLAGNMTITGPGAAFVTVDGGCTGCDGGLAPTDGVTVFMVNSGVTVSISGLTIQHGLARIPDPGIDPDSNSGGGGIANFGGNLTVTNTILRNNATFNFDFFSRKYSGGAIYTSGGQVVVQSSTLSGNTAINGGGGGIYSGGGTVTVTNSTLSGNRGNGFFGGGGIYSGGGTVTVTNSTLSGNSANGFGGGGILNSGGAVTVTNTIVAGNTAGSGPDLITPTATITSGGHNLFGTTSGATITLGPGDLVNPTPRLGTLGSNGGPTQTISLLTGSPAIDAGDDTVCASTTTPAGAAVSGKDQRGIPRPQGTHCDIGAFEVAVVNALPGAKPSAPAGGPTNPLPAVRPAGASGQGGPAPNPLPAPRP